MNISIIIPVYNEEKNIPLLVEKLIACPALQGRTWEAIFIDDGSSDGTFEALREITQRMPEIKVIRFGINAGKGAAYSAGFHLASGDVVVTMDGDLQDDPAEISSFLAALNERADIVVGWKYRGKGPTTKTIPSKIFNRLVSFVTGLDINDSNCPFRAMRKEVAKSLNIYGDLYRFIPYLAFQKGYRVTQIRTETYPRQFGKSKYGLRRLYNGLMDLMTILFVTRYSKSPLHFFGIPGLISIAVGFSIDLFLVLRGYLVTGYIGHTALLIMGVLLMILGVQLFSLGLLGELFITQRKAELKDLPVQEILS